MTQIEKPSLKRKQSRAETRDFPEVRRLSDRSDSASDQSDSAFNWDAFTVRLIKPGLIHLVFYLRRFSSIRATTTVHSKIK